MSQQSFTQKETVIGQDIFLEIPRNQHYSIKGLSVIGN